MSHKRAEEQPNHSRIPKAVLVEYWEYQALLNRLDDLEDLLVMKEALESPEEEAMTLDEFDRWYEARVTG